MVKAWVVGPITSIPVLPPGTRAVVEFEDSERVRMSAKVVITVPLFAANRDNQLLVHAGSRIKSREAAVTLYKPVVPIPMADVLDS